MNFPPMAWIILALGVLWLGLRLWSRKAEERRQSARDARMEELLAERERLLGEAEGATQTGVVDAPAARDARVCAGCRTANAADATTCHGCGLEL